MKVLHVFIVSFILLSACTQQKVETAPPHWTYEGEEGPSHWDELDESYAACGGLYQSPIDIASSAQEDLANISLHYQPSEVSILNNGHTVQVNYDAGSYIEMDGARYDVTQFHYHTPSEHSIDGRSFAAEFHIVHKSADGKLAVIGILLEEGAKNNAYQPFVDNLPTQKSEAHDAGVTINAADLLPTVQTTFRYSGSLTTPPCTEGVNWLLMTTPVELSAEQLHALESLFEEGNNRPVQPAHDRTLIEDTTP